MSNHIGPSDVALSAFLRRQRNRILAAWEEQARKLPRAAGISQPQLIDFIPPLLDHIADVVERLSVGEASELTAETAERHALDRLQEGFDLAEVITELLLLRRCILNLWLQEQGPPLDGGEQDTLNRAVDQTIVASAARYSNAHTRALRVLDRISSTALSAEGLDDLLHQLAVSLEQEVPSVDSVTILLVEGDRLKLRAAAGLEEGLAGALSVRLGEGFAGRIAASGHAQQLRSASGEADLGSDVLRAAGVRALYGLPLIDSGQLIGVAQMGSLTADDFSGQDRVLFASMAARATAAIQQHLLMEQVEQRARELVESERRFRATFENAAAGIAHIAPDGTWLRLNAKYCEILGRSEDELKARRFLELIHPEDFNTELDNFERVRSGAADGYTTEKRYVRRDGNIVWVELAVAAVTDDTGRPDYLVAIVQDVTAERQLRERLEFLSRAGEVLGSTLDLDRTLEHVVQLAVPVIADWCAVDILDHEGRLGDFVAVAHRNPEMVDLVRDMRRRYPPQPDTPVGTAKVLQTKRPELIEEVDDALLQRVAHDQQHLQFLRSLSIRSLLVVPMTREDRVIGTLLLATASGGRTLTREDLLFAEELARRASSAIENARLHNESEQAVTLREQILAIVSHDLRNPIGSIDLAATVLHANAAVRSDPDARSRVEAIQRGVRHASRLIDDLLDVSSIQAGKLSLELRSCELAPLLAESLDNHAPIAAERSIQLQRELNLHGDRVRCDRHRLMQVLSNLIGNALKFCTPGDRVTVRAERDGDRIVVRVADTGPGIAAAEVENIFDLYWKGRERRQRGAGLGLFIARGIVQSHGGRLWVETREGEGSTFSFTLPRAGGPGDDV